MCVGGGGGGKWRKAPTDSWKRVNEHGNKKLSFFEKKIKLSNIKVKNIWPEPSLNFETNLSLKLF